MSEPKQLPACQCPYPYIGTQWVGMRIFCEGCGCMVDEAAADRLERVHDEAMKRLREESGNDDLEPPDSLRTP